MSRVSLQDVRARLSRFIDEGAMDGCALAVAKGGERVEEWYAGEASPGQRAGPQTLWPLACISKVFTAAAVMALVERGELTLSMPVQTLLPSFSKGGREAVRLRHLLTHTSGIARAKPEKVEALMLRKAPLADHLAEAFDAPLLFAPGTAFHYTDHGYALAGLLCEAVTNRSFPEAVRALVFEPAGLKETFLAPPAQVFDRIAYVKGVLAEGTDGAMYNSAYGRQLAHPGLGYLASVSDLLRFGLMFAPDAPLRLHSEATVRCMTTDQTGGDAVGRVMELYPPLRQPWGLGFSVRGAMGNGFEDLASPATFDHAGAAGSVLFVDPVARVTMAFVSNRFIATGVDGFVQRLSTVISMVLAALT